MNIYNTLGNNNQPFKYNGKEYETMLSLNMSDYGARWQDPAIGRFSTIDPHSEKYYNLSPYVYCGNNPINYIDPNGLEKIIFLYPTTYTTVNNNGPASFIGMSNRPLIEAAINFIENNQAVHIYAHGSSESIYFSLLDTPCPIFVLDYSDVHEAFLQQNYGLYMSLTDVPMQGYFGAKTTDIGSVMTTILDINSSLWHNSSETNRPPIVLHSCNTGNENMGHSSFAKVLSTLLPNVSIFAPSNIINASDEVEGGTWNEYLDGKLINKYSGDTVPYSENW